MKKLGFLLAATAGFLLTTSSARAGLMISELADGVLGGGEPKFVELTNTGPGTVDLANYRVGLFSNGSTVENTFTPMVYGDITGILAAGDSFVIAHTAAVDATNEFDATFNPPIAGLFQAAPDAAAGNINHNGDDAYQLFENDGFGGDVLRDVFGQVGIDGTSTFWENTDSFAFRKLSAGPNTTFTASEWFFGAPNALEAAPFDDPTEIANMRTLLTPGFFVPEPATLALLGIGGLLMMRRRS